MIESFPSDMKQTALTLSILTGAASFASAVTFYTPVSITSPNSSEFFPITNLHQGPGVGYQAAEPHDGIIGSNTWVTIAPAPFPADYYNFSPAPVLVIDLGVDRPLTEISTWGYTTGNANGVSLFSLRFATSAEGTGGFGTSIPGQGNFTANMSDVTRHSHPLLPVSARYVEFTALDNYWSNGGNGPPPGGDRVGLGEIAFQVIPEPASTLTLGGLAVLGLLRRRRA